MLAPWKRIAMSNLDSVLKIRDNTLPAKVHIVKAVFFLVVTYGCESWPTMKAEHPKNWYFWTMVLEKTLESPLDSKAIKPVNSKGNQPWIVIGRTNAEAETPILWPPESKTDSLKKTLSCEKLRAGGERGTEDKMVGGNMDSMYMSEQTQGDCDGQRSLACCSSCGHNEWERT